MKKYNWRKNFTCFGFKNNQKIKGKLAIKTKETHWQDTEEPIVIPLSIHSNFHSDIDGSFKMQALTSTIQEHVKGKKTILLTEMAHLNVFSLQFHGDRQTALAKSLSDANKLLERFQNTFSGYKLVFWHEYIRNDPSYPLFQEKVLQLYQMDDVFRELLFEDAESTYTPDRAAKFSKKSLFIEKTVEDLIEQCIGALVLANKAYKYSFYPGPSFKAVEYVNKTLLEKNRRLEMINLFITIEKKSYC